MAYFSPPSAHPIFTSAQGCTAESQGRTVSGFNDPTNMYGTVESSDQLLCVYRGMKDVCCLDSRPPLSPYVGAFLQQVDKVYTPALYREGPFLQGLTFHFIRPPEEEFVFPLKKIKTLKWPRHWADADNIGSFSRW